MVLYPYICRTPKERVRSEVDSLRLKPFCTVSLPLSMCSSLRPAPGLFSAHGRTTGGTLRG